MYGQCAQFDAGAQNSNEIPMSSGQQTQAPFMNAYASSQQPNMMPPMRQQAQAPFMNGFANNQQPNMMMSGQQAQNPSMDTFLNNQQSNLMSSAQQAQPPFMNAFVNNQQPDSMMQLMREFQAFHQFKNAFNGNPQMQMNQGQLMNGLASIQQSKNTYVDQAQQQNMSQLKHGQENAPFMNAMNPPNRENYENAAHSKKARLDQGSADLSQYPPFAQSNTSGIPASMQGHQKFPDTSVTSPTFFNNVPVSLFFPTNHSTSLHHQLSIFNNPIEQVKNPKIEQLKRAIQELDKHNIPELAQARKILSDDLGILERNENESWLDFKASDTTTLVKYVLLHQRRDMNIIGYLLGTNGSKLKSICKTYNCKINVLGAGSTGNLERESQLLRSKDPKHQHFVLPLHLKIWMKGPLLQVYERFWKVLDVISHIVNTNPSFNLGENFTNNNKTLSKQHNQIEKGSKQARKRRESEIMANANEIPSDGQGAKMPAETQKSSELPAKKARSEIVTID